MEVVNEVVGNVDCDVGERCQKTMDTDGENVSAIKKRSTPHARRGR